MVARPPRRATAFAAAWVALVACASSSGCETDEHPTQGPTEGIGEGTGETSTGLTDGTSAGDPAGWTVAEELSEDVGTMLSVWGPRNDALYAVGGQEPVQPGPSTGAMMRYDGQRWRQVELPAGTGKLNWVTGIEAHRFVVGDGGTILHRQGDDDVAAWTRLDCDTTLPLWGVWAAAPDDVWVVGGDGFNRPPVLCHFDGQAATQVELPELSVRAHALFKVWGSSATDVFAVGHSGVIIHFDGQTWAEQPSGTELDLISLWGTGPGEVLAVGGRSHAVLVRYDGERWQARELPDSLGRNGVWMDPGGRSSVVGAMGAIDEVEPGTLEPTTLPPVTPLSLHAVFGMPQGGQVAVGGSFDGSPPFRGIILMQQEDQD